MLTGSAAAGAAGRCTERAGGVRGVRGVGGAKVAFERQGDLIAVFSRRVSATIVLGNCGEGCDGTALCYEL